MIMDISLSHLGLMQACVSHQYGHSCDLAQCCFTTQSDPNGGSKPL